ncbi:MAG: hypothetical protein WAO12_06725, partial [Venatoribacter sp.]
MRKVLQSFPIVLVILGLLSLSNSVLASPAELLSSLQQMRLATTNAVTNFYMFSGLEADSKYNRLIDNSISKFEAALERAKEPADAAKMTDDLKSIQEQWAILIDLINTNRSDIIKQGFANTRLVDQMGRTSLALTKTISQTYQRTEEVTRIKLSAAIQKSRELAVLMEDITSQYAARGTSSLGHVFMGSFERTLNEEADEFNKKLAELSKTLTTKETDYLINNIQSKWRFMESRIRNFNERTVPFLVVS